MALPALFWLSRGGPLSAVAGGYVDEMCGQDRTWWEAGRAGSSRPAAYAWLMPEQAAAHAELLVCSSSRWCYGVQ